MRLTYEQEAKKNRSEENKHKKKRATVGSDRPFQLILLCQLKTRSLYQI